MFKTFCDINTVIIPMCVYSISSHYKSELNRVTGLQTC